MHLGVRRYDDVFCFRGSTGLGWLTSSKLKPEPAHNLCFPAGTTIYPPSQSMCRVRERVLLSMVLDQKASETCIGSEEDRPKRPCRVKHHRQVIIAFLAPPPDIEYDENPKQRKTHANTKKTKP